MADAIAAGWRCCEIDALVNRMAYNLPDATAAYLVSKAGPAANDTQAPASRITPTEGASLPIREDAAVSAGIVDGFEAWKTPQGEPYITLRRKGHFEHWATGAKTFRDYLAYQHYVSEGKAPSNSALDDKRRMFEGVAKFEGEGNPPRN
ncbi:hypothetical protein [Parasedimentitalea psychrophila]|uniref:Uncharacterized protein n=2 Tax=Parasedimentitalea psychrophila TaxID=2997337 RepID=A0A9Y2P8W2_9RHOB|nr:hypothetical protein [Parasedimentitalea psychrophila]WIY27330.1 hypothetical protein QPJ95_10660 [Parasedimentitalea psychrophila]